MLTVPEAARRVHRDPETVRRWIRTGKLRSQKVGTQHLIDEEELDAFVNDDDDEMLPLPEAWRGMEDGAPQPHWGRSIPPPRAGHGRSSWARAPSCRRAPRKAGSPDSRARIWSRRHSCGRKFGHRSTKPRGVERSILQRLFGPTNDSTARRFGRERIGGSGVRRGALPTSWA